MEKLPTERKTGNNQVLPSKQQVNLKELLAVVMRRKWIILAIAIPIIVISTLGTLRTIDFFTASARVMVEAAQPENPTFYKRVVNYDVLMSSAAQVAMSVPVARKAASALFDSLDTLIRIDPLFAQARTAEDLVGVVSNGTNCNQIGESNLLRFSFRHSNPRFALLACQSLLDAYIQFNTESQQRTEAIAYYEDQIAAVQAEVDSLMTLKSQIRGQYGVASMQKDANTGINQVMVLEQVYLQARSGRVSLETQLKGLRDAIDLNPDFVPGVRPGENSNLIGLKHALDAQVLEAAKMKVKYKEDSSFLARQYELIDETREELYRERENYIKDLQIRLTEAKEKEATYLEAIDRHKQDLEEFPEVERKVESIDVQISSLRDLLESLELKRGEVRLKAFSDVRISNIVRIDDPRIDATVAGGKKILYLAVASAFAIVLGFLSALFIENQDHRIYDRRQAEQALEIPVLGAISRIPPEKIKS